MLFALSGLHGYPVEAGDDHVGSVKDFLFDDQTWKVRWMVVDTGNLLPGRQVLIHPSSIAPLDLALPVKRVLPMMSKAETLVVSVRLTRQQIEASPEAREDEPVTKQMETACTTIMGGIHHGERPISAQRHRCAAFCAADLFRSCGASGGGHGEPSRRRRSASPQCRLGQWLSRPRNGRPPRSRREFPCRRRQLGHSLSRHCHAGLVAGKACPVGPFAVKGIDWSEHRIDVDVTRDQVKSSPAWDPLAVADRISEQQLHRHFGWPGYGW